MTKYGLNWPPIQLDATCDRVGWLCEPPPWKILKILNCLTWVQTMWKTTLDVSQVLSNHTKPYQTHNYEVIWIFQKIPILDFFVLSKNNFSSVFSNSYVPCLMSNVQCLRSYVQLKLILTIPGLLELDSLAASSCLFSVNNY